jgi:UDP-N-acetylmuramyl tripeptide synthase
MGDVTVVLATLDRLMREGLDRHDAIHAIGSVLMGIFFDVPKEPGKHVNINAEYGCQLAELTAASWRSQ